MRHPCWKRCVGSASGLTWGGVAIAEKKLPVIETAVIAWRDAFRAIEVMPAVASIAFVLYLAMSLTISAINVSPYSLVDSLWLPIVSVGASVVQAALLAPLAIAVHRFVLLGENANRYPLEPKSSRYLRFVGFAILVKILWLIPSTIESLLPAARDIDPDVATGLRIVAFVLVIAIVIILVRRAILFPAIAVDAPGATWSKARLDTMGSSWRVAFVFVLTALPILAINGLLAWFWLPLTPQAQLNSGSFLFFSAIEAVIAIAALCAYAAAASHIYRARADFMTVRSGRLDSNGAT